MGEGGKFASKLMYYLGRVGLIPKLNMLTFENLERLILENGFNIENKKNLSKTPRGYFIIAQKI